jgi:FAD/FMN-containing dehydrogenase
MSTTLPPADSMIRQFGAELSGQIVCPDDAGFDDARSVWNGMINRRPAVIAQCADRDDVVRAVRFARQSELPLAVRGGGHNAAGLAVCDGGVVVDLRRMRAVHVDAAQRTARVQGGATWAEFDAATQAHGLATTGGVISSTGVGGLTLGGGIGLLMRSYGLACDNLIAAEVVTADGRILTANATENADLFWAIRGGGGNFGVITEFTFKLHPVSQVVGGMLVHPAERARDVLRVFREVTQSAPDELTAITVLTTSPDGMRMAANVACYNGPEAAAEPALRALRSFGPPLADMIAPMPYTQQQRMLDEGFPRGLQVYWRGAFLRELSDACIDVLVERFSAITSPLSAMIVEHLGGAVSRVPDDATAFAHRSAPYNLGIIGRWIDPSEREKHIAWTRETSAAMRPFESGAYVNYMGLDEEADRVKAAYPPQKYARLAAIKRRYDPTNLFRLNQNIVPAAE